MCMWICLAVFLTFSPCDHFRIQGVYICFTLFSINMYYVLSMHDLIFLLFLVFFQCCKLH